VASLGIGPEGSDSDDEVPLLTRSFASQGMPWFYLLLAEGIKTVVLVV
jgi:hypothetical protein